MNAPAGERLDWEAIVALIADNDPASIEILDVHFSKGLCFLAQRYCGRELADKVVYKTILGTVASIRKGELTSPDLLPKHMLTILKRTASEVSGPQTGEQPPADSDRFLSGPRMAVLKKMIEAMKPRHREFLTRFYLQGQSPESIIHKMHLTQKQFLDMKNDCRTLLLSARSQPSATIPEHSHPVNPVA